MIQRLLTFFLVTLFAYCFIPIQKIHASSNFTTDYHVTYTAADDGITHALLDITLTNTTSDLYASSYKMHLGFDEISNVKINDAGGPIQPVIEKTADGYIIGITFNKKSVGLNSKQPFTIAFDTPGIAKKYGQIWEINIPGISNPDEFKSFIVEVKTPASFGKPSYTKPNQPSNNLVFTKEQLGRSGISIAFGDKQIYAFNLLYHLKNNNAIPLKTEIAVPASTNYQEVFITRMNPEPENVTVDKDGNWLAQYTLLPSQKIDVAVSGKAEVSLTPKQVILTQAELTAYTAEQPQWQTKSDEIRSMADELKTPEAIYNYVVQTLHYDFTRVTDEKPRLGAVAALKDKKSAACREFTDLFIAIARAAGIPAREVNGFAFTENPKQRPLSLVQDILHAWPEYYDMNKKTWVMVDPTWGSTTGGIDYFSTLDVDHFSFVVRGYQSAYPVAAGDYKVNDGKQVKDVLVSFGDDLSEKSTEVYIDSGIPKNSMGGFPILGKVVIKNIGTSFLVPQVMQVNSTYLTPDDQIFTTVGIPPFGHTTMNVSFQATPILAKKDASFTVRIAGKTYNQEVKVSPLYLTVAGVAGVIFVLLVGFVLIVLGQSRRLRR